MFLALLNNGISQDLHQHLVEFLIVSFTIFDAKLEIPHGLVEAYIIFNHESLFKYYDYGVREFSLQYYVMKSHKVMKYLELIYYYAISFLSFHLGFCDFFYLLHY